MKRPKLTGVNHYNVFPFNHGGSLAIRGLYKGLSEWFDVNIVAFITHDCYPRELNISNHIRITTIVLPEELIQSQEAMYEKYGMSDDTVIDSAPAVAALYHQYPEIVNQVREIAADSVAVLAEHVYTWRLIKTACPEKHLWYRAHNVEYDYKKTTWDAIGCPEDLLRETFEIEKECCEESDRILTISQLEAERFMELYRLPEAARKKIININAGFDTDNLQTVLPSQREKLSMDYDYSGLFIASDTPHTRRAADYCVAAAEKCPDVQIIIAGRVGKAYQEKPLPKNVLVTGVISDEEKMHYLQHCDFALNPLDGGAGVNVKMFEYFAFGIPVITTAYGARGIEVTAGKDCAMADGSGLAEAIKDFCALPAKEKDKIASAALELLQEKYSWRGIGRKIASEIESSCGISVLDNVLPLDEIALYHFEVGQPYRPKQPFYIRCAGDFGMKCMELLKKFGLRPIAFVDDKKAEKVGDIDGVPIITIEQYLSQRDDAEVIVAIGKYWPEVAAELVGRGVPLDRISLSWAGKYILSMADLSGNCPLYFEPVKYKKAIIRESESVQTKTE